MITDTSLMEVVFHVKFSSVFVYFFVCMCFHIFAKGESKQFPLVQAGQDDYRHKFDGSRPIMEPSLLPGHYYNNPHGLLGVPFSGQT